MVASLKLGVFVGGKSTRMGGRPKGLLPARDTGEPLVARLVRIARELDFEPMLVGRAEPYLPVVPQVPALVDHPHGVGPLGGLGALLLAARGAPAIAVACDMPFVTQELLARLGTEQPQATVLAPHATADGPKWEPLFARYDSAAVLPRLQSALAQGVRSFQRFFTLLDVEQLTLTDDERRLLHDWDCPEDMNA